MANERFVIQFIVDDCPTFPLTVTDAKVDRETWSVRYTLSGKPDTSIAIRSNQGAVDWKGCYVYHAGTGKELLDLYFESLPDDAPRDGTLTASDCGISEGTVLVHYKNWDVERVEIEMDCGLEDVGYKWPPESPTEPVTTSQN